jgi:hypothetical protein
MSDDATPATPGASAQDTSEDLANDRMVKMATTVAALAAGFAAQRALQAGWRLATGKPAPGADDREVSLGEVLVFTALSAAAVAVIRVWATRSARKMLAHQRVARAGS